MKEGDVGCGVSGFAEAGLTCGRNSFFPCVRGHHLPPQRLPLLPPSPQRLAQNNDRRPLLKPAAGQVGSLPDRKKRRTPSARHHASQGSNQPGRACQPLWCDCSTSRRPSAALFICGLSDGNPQLLQVWMSVSSLLGCDHEMREEMRCLRKWTKTSTACPCSTWETGPPAQGSHPVFTAQTNPHPCQRFNGATLFVTNGYDDAFTSSQAAGSQLASLARCLPGSSIRWHLTVTLDS
ncbi:hypothetical protein B0T14DRAFT_274874 [Immersiella caudata]|uniref:Uncharacterized protein n=1 Tax=Immersiella caudata TaxID=314043 RepID=A0AA39WLR4_9PEZI|nr:hypothetical protein B0T14DRAFT_274874 [Immersiella caudata]